MNSCRRPIVSLILFAAAGMCISVLAQTPKREGSKSNLPSQYKRLYEDSHLRLIEVTLRPGEKVATPFDDAYTAVLAIDAVQAKTKNTEMDPDSPLSATVGRGPAPKGKDFPVCMMVGPEVAYQPENVDTFPTHFYRIEFKRVDGDDFKTEWAKWYPYLDHRMTVWEWLRSPGAEHPYGQAVEPTFSGDGSAQTINPGAFPYPDKYDSFRVAPGQHWLRYQDDHVRFLEVMYRAGEQGDGLHGHPYSSVFTHDSIAGKATDEHLDPDSPINNGGMVGRSLGPQGLKYPTCNTMDPQAPHRPHNVDTFPIHFYRLEFRRVDGEDFKTHWAQWYPWMTKS